jgi:hypothetical protein
MIQQSGLDCHQQQRRMGMPADGQEMSSDAAPECVPDEAPADGSEPANTQRMQAERNEAGQFLPGQSGNPAGRMPGTRNRATMIVEQLFDGAGPDLARDAISMARGGDGQLLRQILRSIGPRRHRASGFALPPFNTAADVAPAMAAIAAAAAEGEITTAEAAEMSQVVERYSRALELGEIEARLNRLESANGIAR